MRIACFKHVPFEGPVKIRDWAIARGHSVAEHEWFRSDAPPNPEDVDMLVVMGGPMNIYQDEQYPWLPRERGYIKEAIAAGTKAVGVCLGAQLIADALGAKVIRGHHTEIGWLPILKADTAEAAACGKELPEGMTVFHWHGDTFPLPDGAVLLAGSTACENQIFQHGNSVLGLQCHLESTPDGVRAMVENMADEIVDGPFIQSAEAILAAPHGWFEAMHERLFAMLDRLVEG